MSLTVSDLRAALSELPDDMLVVMAKDAEGNDYSPLEGVAEAMYLAESTWSGEVYSTSEELAARMSAPGSGWTDEDAAPEGSVRCVVLDPTN